MRTNGLWILALGLLGFVSACGYLDEDIALSDEEFQASFDAEGMGTLRGRSSSYHSGCGIGLGTSTVGGHGTHRLGQPRLGRRASTTIDLGATHITGTVRDRASAQYVVLDRSDEDDAQDTWVYPSGELETWGDYLEAELQRARR